MKILIIRNDNIGDLVCTTPLIEVLRAAYPEATIDLLGNSYNIEILRYDQRLSRLWSYNKAGHTKDLRKKIKAWIGKVSLLWRLRRERYDIVILATAVFNKRTTTLARSIHPKAIYGAAPQKADLKHLPSSYHCVEIDGSISHTLQVLTYARALGLKEPFPKRTLLSLSAEEKKQALQERSLVLKNNMCRMRVLSKLAAIDEVQEVELAQKARLHKVLEPSRTDATQQLARGVEFQENVIIGIQLSARRPRQRWSFEQWKELITSLLPYGHLRQLLHHLRLRLPHQWLTSSHQPAIFRSQYSQIINYPKLNPTIRSSYKQTPTPLGKSSQSITELCRCATMQTSGLL